MILFLILNFENDICSEPDYDPPELQSCLPAAFRYYPLLADPFVGKSTFLSSLNKAPQPSATFEFTDLLLNTIFILDFTSTATSASPILTILLYDITNYDSFAYLKQLQSSTSPLTFLIGNKLDLANANANENEETLRAVEQEEAQEWAQARGYMQAEVSAHTRRNVEMVIKMIKTRIVKMYTQGEIVEDRIINIDDRR